MIHFKNSCRIVLLLVSTFFFISCETSTKVLYADGFDKNLDNWVIEQMEDGFVEIKNKQLEISQGNGAVVWFKHKLQAPLTIEYNITVVDNGGKHDRVADMNCFWMANDPTNIDFFKNSEQRGGVFSNYFPLSLYYVGYGGHNNTKTRFRKHFGNGDRPLKPEHDLNNPNFLITPNKVNHIKIVVTENSTQYFCNNNLVYNIEDKNLYRSGYFGFRSYKNHLLIDNFNITKP
ncbi:DUF6250 domain-containing protein [uncultured Lutibacter sp.]|uniref:DUF6250 domain-containing protein n=1 Tax=uncultured Lutibacter sp. TaxID=437739 RepID=UPI0026109DFD|nr:DUF6250 domain-containing protein [uncultured Lutibacter sp.]